MGEIVYHDPAKVNVFIYKALFSINELRKYNEQKFISL